MHAHLRNGSWRQYCRRADALGDLGIDLAEVTQLGTISLVDGQPLQSNTTDLPLAAFLNADTNDVVTFLIADMTAQTEWRLVARSIAASRACGLDFSRNPAIPTSTAPSISTISPRSARTT